MKTKITFLLAALLITLFSVNANAQSNTTPIKGDVNGDGVVDVADINAIIAIMKNGGGTNDGKYWFSIGPEEITANNYTTANNAAQVTEYPTSYTSDARQYIYCLVPNTKTVQFIEPTFNAPIDLYEQNVNIPGSKVYKSSSKIMGTINLKIEDNVAYWFSIGPEEITADNYTTANNAAQVTEYPTSYESTARQYLYCIIPDTKTIQFIEPTLNAPIELYEQSVNIPRHKVYKSSSKIMGTINLKIE